MRVFDNVAVHVLDVAAGLSDIWGLNIVPSTATAGSVTYECRADDRYAIDASRFTRRP